jgi:hypothetical protein
MALLDLQAMQTEEFPSARPKPSHGSKSCGGGGGGGGGSHLSVLCDVL